MNYIIFEDVRLIYLNRLLRVLLPIFFSVIVLSSCEERTGYLDDSQKDIISRLTSSNWKLVYDHTPGFEPQNITGDTWVYHFSPDMTGWMRWETDNDHSEPLYFRWTFTNRNMAVIQLIGQVESYMLIDKLTDTEFHTYRSVSDPVLYPDEASYYRFTAI